MVLIVEDNKNDIDVLNLVSNSVSPNLDITFVSSLSDTFKHLKVNNYRAILLDLGLPDSWGYETFKKVKDHVKDVPIIIYSSLNDEGMSLMALRNGATKYYIKGVDTEKEIFDYLNKICGEPQNQNIPLKSLDPGIGLTSELMETYRKKLNHDLRSCLSNIKSFQRIIVEELKPEDPEMKDFLNRIRLRCDDGLNILDQIYN